MKVYIVFYGTEQKKSMAWLCNSTAYI